MSKVLLDTNIIIHRETHKIKINEIGQLFYWLDKAKYTKCVHPITVEELDKYTGQYKETMKVKLDSYYVLKTVAPLNDEIQKIIDNVDQNNNDINDTLILNEVYSGRVDYLITEDKKIHYKANILGIRDKVYKIEEFIEKIIAEQPSLVNYNVLSVRKEYFGNIDLRDHFFDQFKEDYKGFEKWFNKKADEIAYIAEYKGKIGAFLYLKIEDSTENYYNISPAFVPKKRLKIGTMKVSLTGFRLGERLLKIVFDNALANNVDEIYVTIFEKRFGQKLLIDFLEDFGFYKYGIKTTDSGQELVMVKDFRPSYFDFNNPAQSFPFISSKSKVYFTSIYPKYHTELFPDAILRNESPMDFRENKPHRNAIKKVYVSRAIDRPLEKGDILLFYRTGGKYKGIITTIGVVEKTYQNVKSFSELKSITRKRTVLTDEELRYYWEYQNPYIVEFLYNYSFTLSDHRRPNLKTLVEDLQIFDGYTNLPRGFGQISWESFIKIFNYAKGNKRIIID